jgi:hypothetical protein
VWTCLAGWTYNAGVKLRRIEDWLARLLEGGVGRLLGARLQPVDIAKRLAEYMDDHRTIGAGRLYVPNNYRVYLAPATKNGFSRFEATLHDELAEYLRSHAQGRGYSLVGRLRVTVLADSSVAPEGMRIEADLVDRSGLVLDGARQTTEPIPVAAPDKPVVPRLSLSLGDRSVDLSQHSTVGIGRALDNDVILDDASVSRHHARLIARAGSWLLEDLSSSGGTFLNGRPVESEYVRQGDEIRLGAVFLVVEGGQGSGGEAK